MLSLNSYKVCRHLNFQISILVSFLVFFLVFKSEIVLSKQTLNILTYKSFASDYGAGKKLKEIFERKHDALIKYIAMKDANLILARVILDAGAGSTDIILGIDNNLLKKAEASGLLAKHGIINKNPGLRLDRDLASKMMLAFDYGFFAFLHSSTNYPIVASSFDKFLNAKNKTKVLVLQDPRSSSPGLSFLNWLQLNYPKNTLAILKKLNSRVITYTKGWSESYQLFLNNEAKLVFSYSTSPVYHILEEENYDIVEWDTKKSHIMQVEYAGILKSSKNFLLSQKFLETLISAEFQKILPTLQWMYPMTDVELPKEFKKAIPETASLPEPLTSSEVDRLIDLWEKSFR